MASARRSFSPVTSIVFDLDGTLVDSAPDLADALNVTLLAFDRPALSLVEIRRMIGDGAAKLVERGLSATGGVGANETLSRAVAAFIDHYGERLVNRTRPYPGAVDCLRTLTERGHRLGLCTNKPRAATERMLESLDLGRWFAVVGAGDAPFRKPDPRHLLDVIAALGAEPARSLLVGDSPNDVAAARGAAVPAIVVSYGYSSVPIGELGADAIIDSLSDLPGLVDD